MGEPIRDDALLTDVEPAEVGLDAGRLERIDAHFARYVDDGRLAGWLVLVARHGRIAHVATCGHRDRERDLPVSADTLWRLYSMTKPVTSVAALMCYEEGLFELKDPVSRWIPSFAGARVYRGGSSSDTATAPVNEPVRVWHLLTHTAGLTYGFHHAHPVDALYRAAGFEWGTPPGMDLAGCCDAWAGLPLLYEPGSEWNYSVATDVLGRVVEVASGQSLEEFFRTRIFQPLDLRDLAFWAEGPAAERLAALYTAHPRRKTAVPADGRGAEQRPPAWSGGSGLIGTARDYYRFAEMLRRGGELDGTRLLGPRTVSYMTRNHLPGDVDLERFGRRLFAETAFDGVGFGLGVSVVLDPAATKVLGSKGEYGWGGAASTAFWVSPSDDLTVLFLTQLLPSSTHPIRTQLKQLVYQAVLDA